MTKEGEALHHSGRPQGPRGGGARGQPGEGTEQAVPGLPVLGHQTLSSDGAHQGHAQQGGALPVRLRREVQDLLRLQRPPEEARTWQLGTGQLMIMFDVTGNALFLWINTDLMNTELTGFLNLISFCW